MDFLGHLVNIRSETSNPWTVEVVHYRNENPHGFTVWRRTEEGARVELTVGADEIESY